MDKEECGGAVALAHVSSVFLRTTAFAVSLAEVLLMNAPPKGFDLIQSAYGLYCRGLTNAALRRGALSEED